jgi:TetR/AcrR family transcriptional regulator, regulator of mycofactocin system
MGIRDDKKQQTRARLERAALDLFARRGYERTTVEEVAALAGVSARTAFRYFPTKADLVFGDAEVDLQALRAHLAAQDESLPAFEAMRVALAEFSQRVGTPANAERSRVIAANQTLTTRSLAERELWAGAVASELAQRGGRDVLEPQDRLGGLLVVAILVAAVREWSSAPDGGEQGLRETVDRMTAAAVEIVQA